MDEILYRNQKPRDEGTTGLALFEPATAPFVKGSATSEAASRRIAKQLSGRRETVFIAFCQHYEQHRVPATDNEIIALLQAQGWSPSAAANGVRNRRAEVQKPLRDELKPLLEEAGERDGCTTYRPTAHGWSTYLDLCHGEAVA